MKHFGVPADKVIVTESSGQKKAYASRGNLLVDDYGRNCREWICKVCGDGRELKNRTLMAFVSNAKRSTNDRLLTGTLQV